MSTPKKDEPLVCACGGLLVRDTNNIVAFMEWHINHGVSQSFTRDFLKLRLHTMAELCDISKLRNPQTDVFREFTGHDNTGDRCGVQTGYKLKPTTDEGWERLKEKFKEIFDPALCRSADTSEVIDENNKVKIISQFELMEKGVS